MNDIYLSLLIVLAVGAAAGLIFWLDARGKKEVRLRMEAYCAQRGYRMEEVRHRLRRETVIRANGWRLTTGIEASDVETQSGSAYTVAYTRWQTDPAGREGSPLLWVGTAPRAAVLPGGSLPQLLAAFGIAGMDAAQLVPLNAPLQDRFAMIAADEPALSQAVDAMTRLLADWPENWPLRVSVGMDFARFTITGRRFDQPGDLDRVIALGTGLLEYQSSVIQREKE